MHPHPMVAILQNQRRVTQPAAGTDSFRAQNTFVSPVPHAVILQTPARRLCLFMTFLNLQYCSPFLLFCYSQSVEVLKSYWEVMLELDLL